MKNLKQSSDKIVVIGGMAKTGTTLPLTLLDGHSKLCVFPEELRFFHHGFDKASKDTIAAKVLCDPHIARFAKGSEFYSSDNYSAHGGTGFGKRDYTAFNWTQFCSLISNWMPQAEFISERFNVLSNAFKIASGQNFKSIFVCKSPHNEIYSKDWISMLGARGIYVFTTRLPTEHYLSLLNVQSIGKNSGMTVGVWGGVNAFNYAKTVMCRRKMWDSIPRNHLFILDYDSFLQNPAKIMSQVLDFIGVDYESSVGNPTKMGTAWSGNSSRGIVKDNIFANPHRAVFELKSRDICYIQYALRKLYKQMGWRKIPMPIACYIKAIPAPRSRAFSFLRKSKKFLPQGLKRQIKKVYWRYAADSLVK